MEGKEGITDKTLIRGRVEYKGQEYFLVWEGTTKAGWKGARLAFQDGSKAFWVKAGSYNATKLYQCFITFGDLTSRRKRSYLREPQPHVPRLPPVKWGVTREDREEWMRRAEARRAAARSANPGIKGSM